MIHGVSQGQQRYQQTNIPGFKLAMFVKGVNGADRIGIYPEVNGAKVCIFSGSGQDGIAIAQSAAELSMFLKFGHTFRTFNAQLQSLLTPTTIGETTATQIMLIRSKDTHSLLTAGNNTAYYRNDNEMQCQDISFTDCGGRIVLTSTLIHDEYRRHQNNAVGGIRVQRGRATIRCPEETVDAYSVPLAQNGLIILASPGLTQFLNVGRGPTHKVIDAACTQDISEALVGISEPAAAISALKVLYEMRRAGRMEQRDVSIVAIGRESG